MRDGRRSRRRVLDAAVAEFAERGIAGARVDRIAASAGVNKSQMYSYFGSKDGLFDAVFRDQLEKIVDAVPFTVDDLPGYAARLYDSYVESPELLRLATWYRLERVPAGDLLASVEGHGDPKMRAIADAQRDGRIDPALAPSEVYSLITAIAMTWSPVNVTYAASRDDDESEHARRRSVIREMVSRTLVPTGREGKREPRRARKAAEGGGFLR
jgi:AcrR family transcriptional regulator